MPVGVLSVREMLHRRLGTTVTITMGLEEHL